MYLMLADIKVLYFNFDEFIVQELNPSLVPFSIRHAFSKETSNKALLYNVELLKRWLSSRVLSLGRDNAKSIYTSFSIPQLNDIDTRVKICLRCKAVSLTDSYWVKTDDSSECFNDVNIRIRHFKEIVDIALDGIEPSVTTSPLNPELTTHGLFRKAWVREKDGLYLLKSDRHVDNINTKMEVLASKILECFNNKIDCVRYTGRYRNTKNGRLYVDKCKCFGNDRYSFIEAWEVMEYCKGMNISFRDRALGYSPEAASIGVLDFILVNTDRHNQNYGFWMNNKTGNIVGLAPLFDFNCALVADVFERDATDTLSQMLNDGSTLRQIAYKYRPYNKLAFDMDKLNNLMRNNKEFGSVFDSVLRRCKELGLEA